MRIAFLASLAVSGAVLGAAAHAQTPPPPSTKAFVTAATESDQYEIMAGQDAVTQSRDPRVRAFAQEMIQDHLATSQGLERAVLASGMKPPPKAMSSDQAQMLGALQSLTGPDFDRAYAKQQVLAHAQALAVEGSYASGGSDPNIRQAARTAVPTIRHHAEMAQQLADTFSAR